MPVWSLAALGVALPLLAGVGSRYVVHGNLSAKVPCRRALSRAVWAGVWATCPLFDRSFSDRRPFGVSADVGNGLVTPMPTLVLYAAFALGILPAVAAGILGLTLSWQWTCVTSICLVSFFLAGRHHPLTRVETVAWTGAVNAPWVACPLLGLDVPIRLVLDGNCAVLGF